MSDDHPDETPPPPPPPVPPPPPPSAEWGAPTPPDRPRPRRRRRWPWLLGGVLALVAILITTAIVLYVVKIKPPVDAANDFLEDIEDRNFDRAFDRLCAADQDQITPEGLQTAFGFGRVADDYSVNFLGVDIDGSRATVEFDSDGVGDDFDYYELPLRKEDGDWHVCLSNDPQFNQFTFAGSELNQT
jgi:hypothetical protein